MISWTVRDVYDWLDSLFVPEKKPTCVHHKIDGIRLSSLTKSNLERLGVVRSGHMVNIERSLKCYLTAYLHFL